MKVKVGNSVYDGGKEPVMVILNDEEKKQMSNMGKSTKYCSYPHDEEWIKDDYAKINEWMNAM